MNPATARRAARDLYDELSTEGYILSTLLLESTSRDCITRIARTIRREAIAYHKRALQAARNRERR